MKPLFIFRHIDIEGPGYPTHFLKKHGIHYRLVKVDEGDVIPRSLDNIGGLVFMGGSMSVNDDLPWIHQEITLIKRAAEAKLPILGHCLGGQLISKALGGEVYANPVKEIGWDNLESRIIALHKVADIMYGHWLGLGSNEQLPVL